jgi:hypothetical protein
MKKGLYLFLLLFGMSTQLFGQSNPNDADKLPEWVAMIDNPETNYFEAIQAFNAYWKDKLRPKSEAELAKQLNAVQHRREFLEQPDSSISDAARERYNLLKYHYKRFKNWEQEIKPFVQEDGRILTMQQRIDMWHTQQSEIRNPKK